MTEKREVSIGEFIKKYGKPYDSETDDYNVSPFQENIDDASKSSEIFNVHKYWTKQDPYVVKDILNIIQSREILYLMLSLALE